MPWLGLAGALPLRLGLLLAMNRVAARARITWVKALFYPYLVLKLAFLSAACAASEAQGKFNNA